MIFHGVVGVRKRCITKLWVLIRNISLSCGYLKQGLERNVLLKCGFLNEMFL